MEEKKRYIVSVGSDNITIYDYEEDRVKALNNCGMQSLLNLQDNQIKAKEKEANTYAKEIVFLDNKIKQLKQQLHDLPKKIVEEIKDKIPEIGGMKCEIIIDDSLTLNTLLDTILKKYGG